VKRGLAVDVRAVDIHFVVVEESNNVVNVGMRDRMEHDIASHLFNLAYHKFKFYIIVFIQIVNLIIISFLLK